MSRAGLSLHSDYLLARLTLGRALLQLGQIDVAQRELDLVRGASPRNLACLRALAELHRQRGDMPEALALYRAALAVAPNDPELDQTVGALCQEVVERAEAARELRSTRLLTFLEQWLSAIHVTRAQRSS